MNTSACHCVLCRSKGIACFPSPLGLGRCKAPCLSAGTTVFSSSFCLSCSAAESRWWSLPLKRLPAKQRQLFLLITTRKSCCILSGAFCPFTWVKEAVPFRCLHMLGGWIFWNTVERGRLERVSRGLHLAESSDASPPAKTNGFLLPKRGSKICEWFIPKERVTYRNLTFPQLDKHKSKHVFLTTD